MATIIVNGVARDETAEETAAREALAPSAESILAAKRNAATLTRAEFLLACVAAEIITEAEAEEAADGSWPASFDTFLRGLSFEDRIKARDTWASRADVRRNSALLALVAANRGVSAEELDTLFGIS